MLDSREQSRFGPSRNNVFAPFLSAPSRRAEEPTITVFRPHVQRISSLIYSAGMFDCAGRLPLVPEA
jgi:hypothetical protein